MSRGLKRIQEESRGAKKSQDVRGLKEIKRMMIKGSNMEINGV